MANNKNPNFVILKLHFVTVSYQFYEKYNSQGIICIPHYILVQQKIFYDKVYKIITALSELKYLKAAGFIK